MDLTFLPQPLVVVCNHIVENHHRQHGYSELPRDLWHKKRHNGLYYYTRRSKLTPWSSHSSLENPAILFYWCARNCSSGCVL